MDSEILDLSSLELAIQSLSRGLKRYALDAEDLEVRDACIQRFEYTYELCMKFIKRALEAQADSLDTVEALPFRDKLRVAADMGFIEDPVLWFGYREDRNKTSHTYDQKKAEEVMGQIPLFFEEAVYLLHKLREKNHA